MNESGFRFVITCILFEFLEALLDELAIGFFLILGVTLNEDVGVKGGVSGWLEEERNGDPLVVIHQHAMPRGRVLPVRHDLCRLPGIHHKSILIKGHSVPFSVLCILYLQSPLAVLVEDRKYYRIHMSLTGKLCSIFL